MLRRRDDVLQGVEIPDGLDAAAPPGALTPRAADVLRDLEEPGRFELGANPAAETAVRVEERRLDGVLRLFAVAEQPEAVAEDPLRVPRVEIRGGVSLERPRGLRDGGREGTHGGGGKGARLGEDQWRRLEGRAR